MDMFVAGVALLLDYQVILALLIGAIGGVIIGAIPGVGPAVAIAILLPATFSLPPLVGLVVLLGIYGSSMYGGSLPAILINTPGTAVNALTTYDGYPMTQRGESLKALGLAYGASFFAGVLSIICLILFAPLLAKVAPLFGSKEIFLAALLGLVLVVLSHRGQMLAAGMLVGFGAFIGTVGLEPARFTQRYTFEQEWLASGFDLIVVVLGLFALSQAFLLLTQPEGAPAPTRVQGSIKSAMMRVFRHKRLASVGTGFGVLMGMLPGVGEFTAQFLSYSYAQKTSKSPEAFGNGSEEGLVASESANNAVPAAAMIPLLALGIPGEALTAMMLSVFYVHSVIPGPQLFQNQLDFVYALYIAMILLNVIVVAFVLMSSNLLLKIIRIPTRFLGITILTLSFVGVYSLRNSIVDCAIAAAFGWFGMILKRLDLPAVPIILGMVLGGIMETKFRPAMARVSDFADFFQRPIAAFLGCVILALLIGQIVSLLKSRKTTSD